MGSHLSKQRREHLLQDCVIHISVGVGRFARGLIAVLFMVGMWLHRKVYELRHNCVAAGASIRPGAVHLHWSLHGHRPLFVRVHLVVKKVLTTHGGRSPALREWLVCSECWRWVLPGARMLTATKRLLVTVPGAVPNGGCMRYRGRRASVTRPAPRHCSQPHHARPGGRRKVLQCDDRG